MKKEKKPLWKRILKGISCLILVLVIAVAGLCVATIVTEYNPEPEETVAVEGSGSKEYVYGEPLRILTWNVGYCGLGEQEDFFMDGGQEVFPSSKQAVQDNLEAIEVYLQQTDADAIFLQEVDQNATRTSYINEVASFRSVLDGYASVFANNFKVLFVPYPIPPMGHEDAGIMTFSKYDISDATRIQLPCPFTGIEKIGNLKRCLLVSRIPVANSDKELVLINLHLEAYDSGEGKIAQTKMLAEVMQAEYDKGNYVVVGGDFNQVFDNVDDSMYPAVNGGNWVPGKVDTSVFGSKWTFLMDTTHPTCRSLEKPYANVSSDEDFQFYMIDGFIISNNIQAESVETKDLGFKNSDHNPVEVTLYLSEIQ
ncbi:MAG: endonuclease/exonuclease/phosphatase family protein [Lachnospiraceae bacterium]|nr:endonuclease/exonuclease/phosphatase family protein [Lachnospiraceae bacterium]